MLPPDVATDPRTPRILDASPEHLHYLVRWAHRRAVVAGAVFENRARGTAGATANECRDLATAALSLEQVAATLSAMPVPLPSLVPAVREPWIVRVAWWVCGRR
jgi:hypothetical protein